ncbi:MAG: PP2C family protein-serine/threonine phosphatase [Planctomycetales bacterium]|nr:PP2C family protein-serine/threonine phosphatase [Planctomycetales bacterium]
MAIKVTLILAILAQFVAAILALRLNIRYRIYSAWFFISAAVIVDAIQRFVSAANLWITIEPIQEVNAAASLISAVLLLSGISVLEPFFKRIVQAERTLRREHDALAHRVRETEEEMRLAQRIQRQLLPNQVPDIQGLEIAGESNPAEWTSGDYFDYLPMQNGNVAIVIADVSGHGLGPALLMSTIRTSLRVLAPTTEHVGELLSSSNRLIGESTSPSEFVTAFALQYNPNTRQFSYAAAGHVAYLIPASDTGVFRTMPADVPPLGVVSEFTIPSSTPLVVSEGDILILLTDGILETRNSQGETFGESKMLNSVREHRHESAAEILRCLLEATTRFRGHEPQHDDITAVVIKSRN